MRKLLSEHLIFSCLFTALSHHLPASCRAKTTRESEERDKEARSLREELAIERAATEALRAAVAQRNAVSEGVCGFCLCVFSSCISCSRMFFGLFSVKFALVWFTWALILNQQETGLVSLFALIHILRTELGGFYYVVRTFSSSILSLSLAGAR